MPLGPPIEIADRLHWKNPEVDRYQIDLTDLCDLRMKDIPPHSHLEVMGLPQPEGLYEMEIYGLNAGDKGEHEYLEVYGGASFKTTAEDASQMVSRLQRAFPDMDPKRQQFLRNPYISTKILGDGTLVSIFLNLKFNHKPDTLVRDAVLQFIEGFQRMERPSVHAFICHASEDKAEARELALYMTSFGEEVWFDEWEIKIGDSIVQKISDALDEVSHLIVLLSKSSVKKPWVRKEFSSALMRQLSENSIQVLPVRLDNCSIPPILADIRYADARKGMRQAKDELEETILEI